MSNQENPDTKVLTEFRVTKKMTELAKWIHCAVIQLGGEFAEYQLLINEGRVILNKWENNSCTQSRFVNTVRQEYVENISEFMKSFINFSKETECVIEKMSLNAKPGKGRWHVEARNKRGVAAISFFKDGQIVEIPEREKQALIKIGFRESEQPHKLVYFGDEN